MGDEEDQETPFEEMDGHQLAEKTAWVRLFLREANKRGYRTEDIVGFCLPEGQSQIRSKNT